MNWHTEFTAKLAKNAKKTLINLRGLCALGGSKYYHTEGGDDPKLKGNCKLGILIRKVKYSQLENFTAITE